MMTAQPPAFEFREVVNVNGYGPSIFWTEGCGETGMIQTFWTRDGDGARSISLDPYSLEKIGEKYRGKVLIDSPISADNLNLPYVLRMLREAGI